MTTEWLLEYAKLLSVPLFFDEPTAAELIETLSKDLTAGPAASSEVLTLLRLTGLLVGETDYCRITDAARTELRDLLASENPMLFRRALRISVDHMKHEFRPTVRRVLGSVNSRLLIKMLEFGSRSENDAAPFDMVIRQLSESHRLGRHSGEAIARVALSQLPPTPDHTREVEFLLGSEAWRRSQRSIAQKHFECVLALGVSDLADAISAHLVGVAMSERGDHENALTFLQRSIHTLRRLQDAPGLCQVLTSIGIAERELSSKKLFQADSVEMDSKKRAELIAIADEHFQAAQDHFDEVMELAHSINDPHLEGGAHMELAAGFRTWGDFETAILESETARSIMPSLDENYVRVLTQLGSLYNQNGQYDDANDILREAARVSTYQSTDPIILARLLNVQAANERKRDRMEIAREHAENSIRIGRRLKHERHLGHALHTLALIEIDTARNVADLESAREHLNESAEMLNSVRDTRGLNMVATTISRLEKSRRRLGDSGG